MSVWFWLFLISSTLVSLMTLYVYWLVKHISETDLNLKNMSYNLEQFETHLSNIYEMEMFYGDDTLKSLLSHAKEVRESLQEFQVLLEDPPSPELPDDTGSEE